MRIRCLATAMTLATMTLLGCGGSTATVQPDASVQPEASVRPDASVQPEGSVRPDASVQPEASVRPDASVQPEAFELQGSWLYLGPGDGVHTLKISNGSILYTDVDGQWSSNWTIKDYDNGLHHFQLVFESGTGTYSPTGQSLSGSYVLNDPILTVQLANGLGSYPPVQSPGSCTEEGSNRISNCGIYMKQ
jgi:hypothetical protein